MLDLRNAKRTGHILTLEDPIEYVFRNKKSIVNQREIGSDAVSLETALRNALRQAPDCILIGEIRDKETMTAAMAYAQSGHLCVATLHANNSYHALNRIVSFFPLEMRNTLLSDLSAALKSIISQRLIRARNGGRVPAVEVLINSRHIAELIERGEVNAIQEAMEKSMSPGSQTFEQALYHMIRDEQITEEEALAFADSPTNLLWLLNNAPPPMPSEPVDETTSQVVTSFQEFTLNAC
jgi:twitching motility protein PilU